MTDRDVGKNKLVTELGMTEEESLQLWKDVQYGRASGVTRAVIIRAAKKEPSPTPTCRKCHGAGWVWWDELDSFAGHDPRDLVVDDTRYPCDLCNQEE